jgi:hypothetical protein
MSASLWDQWKTGAYNALSEALTGNPAPGSLGAKQRQLEMEQLDRAIQRERQGTRRPSVAELVRDYEALSGLQGATAARDNQQRLQTLGAPSELAARAVMNQQNITARDALTRNQQSLLTTQGQVDRERLQGKADASLALLHPVLANERYGLEADNALAERYLAHDAARTDQILKAQQSGQVLPFLGGLLATAAALFA